VPVLTSSRQRELAGTPTSCTKIFFRENPYEMHNTYGGHVEERAGQSTTKMKFYVRNILFVVAKDIGKMRHHKKILQGPVVMLVYSLVSTRRMYILCKKS
jgi:hypothetical protein